MMNNDRVIVIGIGGSSCSGKSHLTKRLYSKYKEYCPFEPLEFDNHGFKRRPVPPIQIPHFTDPSKTITYPDFDNCASYDFDKFYTVFTQLISHVTSPLSPSSSTTTNIETDDNVQFTDYVRRNTEYKSSSTTQCKIIFAEGFLLFYEQRITDLLQLKIFLESEKELCKKRRFERSTGLNFNEEMNRGENDQSDIFLEFNNWFDHVIWHYYQLYEQQQKSHEGIIIVDNNDLNCETDVTQIIDEILPQPLVAALTTTTTCTLI